MDENNENAPMESQSEQQPVLKKEETNMAMLCHLLAIFTSFLGPLIIWLIKKDESSFVDDQGKEALNFQITVVIAMLASSVLMVVCIGAILAIAVSIANLVFCIMATIKSSKGEAYRYPFALRLIK